MVVTEPWWVASIREIREHKLGTIRNCVDVSSSDQKFRWASLFPE